MSSPSEREPLVSVAIPSFNHRRYIGRAIDSVLAQTYPNVEVVVVDDGSTDGSPELLATRYGHEPRVRLVARENRGAHATLNEAIGLCRGRFVAILNSDDEFGQTRIATLVARALGAERPYFAFTGLAVVDEDGAEAPETVPAEYYEAVRGRMAGEPTLASFWVGNYAITTSNFFFSREVWDAVGPFSPLRYTHDWDWALRASEKFGVERVDEVLLRYRAHGSNTISEVATWKKLVENAYVFAMALRRVGLDGMALAAEVAPSDVMRALTKNRSFAPVPTLFIATLGRTDAAITEALANGELERMLRELVERDGRRIELLESAARIDETMEREEHLADLLLHWRPIRRVRKVLRNARRDVRAEVRRWGKKLGGEG